MKRLASFVLGHKLLVVLTWLALAVAGFATISTTTHRLTATFSLPGQPGYVTDTRIAALYHNGGGQTPTVLTLTVPAGILISDPGTAARAGRAFAAAAASVPGTRVADAATTGDPHFVTSDGAPRPQSLVCHRTCQAHGRFMVCVLP